MSTSILTYLAPKEAVVNQATVLVGTFDPNFVANISLVAEDKYPLTVTLNPSTGSWYVTLDKGFSAAGDRWLRLKGTDKRGQVVSEQVVNLAIKPQSRTSGSTFTLIALKNTFFKSQPTSTSTNQPTVAIAAGQVLTATSYQLAGDHLKVELTDPLPPIGKSGYFYQNHVLLTAGAAVLRFNPADMPPTPPGTQLLWITQNTPIKQVPDDSSELAANQQVALSQGETYIILGYACVAGHFRVTLAQAIPGFGSSGYIYAPHVQILQGGKQITFDPNAITVTALKTTVIKKQPIDAATLKPTEKVTLPAGMIYGVSSYGFESGHFKVALTENLPQFGNTGYLYPDFVQFSRGDKPFNPSPTLTYTGPKEVLAKQPVVLTGSFDKTVVVTVSLIAEDKYPLTVTLNRSAGTWQVNLNKGFSIAGSRWLRLKAIDRQAKIISSQVIYINVSGDPMTVGQSLNLTVVKDTFFKAAPVDSSRLSQQQKVLVKAGKTWAVSKYGFVDGHLKVLLEEAVAPLGAFGYFYEPHVQLAKGTKTLRFDLADVPNTHLSAQLLVTQTTQIKARPEDSSNLAANEVADLILGSTYAITGYACIAGHFRVTLAESIPGFGNVGYIYWQHIQIKKEGKEVAFDPEAITITVRQTTVIKKRSVDATALNESEKVTLPLGRVYGVDSYGIEDNNIKVALTEELPNFGNTGYIFPAYFLFQRGGKTFNPIPTQVELNVPYFSQRDNPRYYWSTCNVTSISMAFYYYGVRPKWGGPLEDELLQWCFNYAGEGSQTDHTVLSALIRAYGFKTSFSPNRKWSEIKSELINRRPVILAGDFTASGHILCVIGYDSNGYIVNDPWGDALTGYSDTEGAKLLYPYDYINQVAGPDGSVWAHLIWR